MLQYHANELIPLSEINILNVDPQSFANQLTMYEFGIYASISPHEFLNQAWQGPKRKKNAPNLTSLIDRFNEVCSKEFI
jgi:Ras-specific guanine nucleotide-releasing factor 1